MDRYGAFTAMDRIGKASTALCRPDSLEAIWQGSEKGEPMPSLEDMKEILDRLSVALFPGFFGSARIWKESMQYHVSANLDSIYRKLSEQITKMENNDIIGMVREIGMTPEQLAALLSGRTADVPGTEDPDEHEETEEYEHEN